MIAIDKNIPIPEPRYHRGRPRKYPFPFMEKGDSFYVNGTTKRMSLAKLACRAADQFNAKFTVRAIGKGFRVWRIA